jgi:hypothetical protein
MNGPTQAAIVAAPILEALAMLSTAGMPAKPQTRRPAARRRFRDVMKASP